MRNTFCINFLCRPSKKLKSGEAPIEVSISINGKRTYVQLPKKCRPEDFDKLMNSRRDNDIKIYCQTIQAKINEVQTTLTISGEPITPASLKEFIRNGTSPASYTIGRLFEDGLLLKQAENGSISTYNKYKNTVKDFYAYTGHTPEDEVRSICNADILRFKAKCSAEKADVTTAKELQILKYFMSYAFNNGKIKSHPFGVLKIKQGIKEQEFLRTFEVDRIRALRLTNETLLKVRDIFLFLCRSGLEYADLVHLEKDDVKINEKGQPYIQKPRIKTGVEYIAVLYDEAYEIFKSYDGKLPLMSNQRINFYLRDVVSQAEISKKVTTLTGRHTYATFLLSDKKLSIDIVQKMLGHTTTDQTRRYAKMLETAVFDACAPEPPAPQPISPTPARPRREIDEEKLKARELLKKHFGK